MTDAEGGRPPLASLSCFFRFFPLYDGEPGGAFGILL